MNILKILGIIVLLAMAYNLLKEFGVIEFLKGVIGLVLVAFLLSLAAGALFSAFGADFDEIRRISFWVFLIIGALIEIKR